jgi:predicted transcriptional regulator
MKNLNVKVLDDKDTEFVNLLNAVGVPKNVSKALVLINNNGEANSREIEIGTSLRQPDVSIATKEMLRRDWISVEEVKSDETKGRPTKVYKLAIPIADIVSMLEKTVVSKLDETISTLDQLKAISKT